MVLKSLLILLFLFTSATTMAQPQVLQKEDSLYAVVKDMQGNKAEGYLQLSPE
jgi:hypothetical protein